ncbi:MAG: hypothetical protein KatS3mg088_605 [Patescibacteria group bacterium]|nr:MAG: hypothetical protein KatS3mg088_605 [Patescibacteria group bacterium]
MKTVKIWGFTLIEMLVVTGLFAGIAVLVGNLVGTSMKGVRKSESSMKVRSELENAVSIVERSLREAKNNSVSCLDPQNQSPRLSFTDQNGISVNLSCNSNNLVMNGSDLTGANINLSNCGFDCSSLVSNGVVVINLTASSLGTSGVESDVATVSSRIFLRNYLK